MYKKRMTKPKLRIPKTYKDVQDYIKQFNRMNQLVPMPYQNKHELERKGRMENGVFIKEGGDV